MNAQGIIKFDGTAHLTGNNTGCLALAEMPINGKRKAPGAEWQR
jgi:hypothetical protein